VSSAVPSDRDERAFVLPERDVDPSPLLLAEEFEAAFESRRMWGLPTDDGSLVEAVREARLKQHSAGGNYWTQDEQLDDAATVRVWERVDRALEPFDERLAGTRVSWDGHTRVMVIGAVGDLAPLRAAIAGVPGQERVRFEPRPFPLAELEALGDQVETAIDELETLGIVFQESWSDPDAGVYEVVVAGPDEDGGRAALHERFGERLRVNWSARGPFEPRPRAFASWAADGRILTLHCWHDLNGEAPGPCVVTEHADRVEIELQILTPTGPTTLIGGWEPVRTTVELAAPLGARTVVDRVGNVPRPSWQELRDHPPPARAEARESLLVQLIQRLPAGQRIIDHAVAEWGTALPTALTPPLRARLAEPEVRQLIEAVLAHGNDTERRAVLVELIENPILLGPAAAVAAIRSAEGPATRAAVAATDATLAQRRS